MPLSETIRRPRGTWTVIGLILALASGATALARDSGASEHPGEPIDRLPDDVEQVIVIIRMPAPGQRGDQAAGQWRAPDRAVRPSRPVVHRLPLADHQAASEGIAVHAFHRKQRLVYGR